MSQKMFSFAAGLIFLIVAIAHLMRLVLGWSVIINGWPVPMWVSIAAFIGAAFLAFQGLKRRP